MNKGYLVRLIKNLPILHLVYRWYTEVKLKQKRKAENIGQVFKGIYQKNSWNSG